MNKPNRLGPLMAVFLVALYLNGGSPRISAAAPDQVEIDCEELIDIHLPQNPQHADYVMQIQYSDRLVCLVRSEAVFRAFMRRVGLHPKYRDEALVGLAKLHRRSPMTEWLAAISAIDATGVQLDPREGSRDATSMELRSVLDAYIPLWEQMDREDRLESRSELLKIIKNGEIPEVRQLGYAALVNLDGQLKPAWDLAAHHRGGIADIFAAGKWMTPTAARKQLFQDGLLLSVRSSAIDSAFIQFLPYVTGNDEAVFDCLVAYLETPLQSEAIGSLLARDIAKWPSLSLQPLAVKLTQLYSGLDPKARTTGEGKQLANLTDRIAGRLPEGAAATIRARLNGLEVAEHRVIALREQMAFDQDVLVLQAGQPVEITFENQDTMPHNLVIVRPGAMEKVGVAADQMALRPAAEGRQYVPEMAEVLYHTGMINSGESAKLQFIAPEQQGVYPMLCTFPGHWLKMFAAVVVVPDREVYLANNQPLSSREQLLGIQNYVHEYENLAAQLDQSIGKRSFASGQTAFYSRACVSCHAVGGKGGRVGPELSELAVKQRPKEILRSIMYPSEKIDPQYAKVQVEQIETGKVFTGVMIPQDDPNVVYLVDDPLAECEPQVFRKEEVEIVPLKISPMPEQLLRRSKPEEVLDLVAYLYAGGNAEHPIYQAKE